jgi:protein-S-isoprenylcysteine O-methyltransferase Ste14
MIKEQSLITSEPYHFVRHPIYTAFLLGSTLFVSANWLVGFAWLGMTLLELVSRIRFEEGLMLEYFGNEYLSIWNEQEDCFLS